MGIFLLIIGLVLFIGLVVVHELGHFVVARRNGVEAEEFGIFFPPKLWSRKVKGRKGKESFIFSINLLPLGGFVRLRGEHDADTGPGTFGAASTWVKTKIMAAGVAMNLLVAVILFTILAWIGMPQLLTKATVGQKQFTVSSDTKVIRNDVLVGGVQSGSPAAKAGLQTRDQLLSIASATKTERVTTAANLPDLTKHFAGQKVTITYLRDGQVRQTAARLLSAKVVQDSLKSKNQNDWKGYLGVAPAEYTLQRSTWSAPIVALGVTKQFTVLTFKGLWTAVKGLGSIIAGATTGNHKAREAGQTRASSEVSGPVGIFVVLKDGSLLGYQFMLMIVAVISLSLAIMNVLPIPALDGGKLFVTYISRLMRKRVSEQVENWVYGTSFILLIGLVALITVVDVKRFF